MQHEISFISKQCKWPRKYNKSLLNLSLEQWRWLLSGYDILKMQGHQTLEIKNYVTN